MPQLSRWMPPTPQQSAGPSFCPMLILVIGVVAAGVGWVLVHEPAVRIVAAVLLLLAIVGTMADTRRRRRLAIERAGEDIGTFARAFDRRREPFDAWVVRAVWDELQLNLAVGDAPVPLRPDDRLAEDLRIDDEELDLDIIVDVAARSGRSLEGVERNPMYGHVVTVRDLVHLIALQPWRAAA